MVELARAGRGLKQLSREFGVSANAIRIWIQRADSDAAPACRVVAIRRLFRLPSDMSSSSCAGG